jgi:hypothetical protein
MTYDEEAPVLRVREKVVLTVRDEEGLRCGEVSVGAAIPDDGGPRLASVNFSSPRLGGEPPREVVGMIMRPEQLRELADALRREADRIEAGDDAWTGG